MGKKTMPFKALGNDEVTKVRINQAPFSFRITCCDCGLTHDVKILKHDGLAEDELEMIFCRNKRSTSRRRKASNVKDE